MTPPVVSPDGQAVMIIAYPTTSEQESATNALVNRLSGQVVPRAAAGAGLTAHLTGPNAGNVTFANAISARMPWLIGVVVGLSTLPGWLDRILPRSPEPDLVLQPGLPGPGEPVREPAGQGT